MSKTVLIVDDSPACAETLQIALERIPDLICRTARDASAALKILNDGAAVAAIITDLHLPQSSGLELIAHIRAQARLRSVPVFLISGDSDPDLRRKAFAAGADAFFAKPYSPASVRTTLERLLC